MPTISVLTAVHPVGALHIDSAYHSLALQFLPEGWHWEWLVQEDGEDCDLGRKLPRDSRISIDRSPKGGPGPSRSTALGRASGTLIKVLDADDMLAPGALSRDILTATNHRVSWTVSAALDLFPDGSIASPDWHPDHGPLPRGSLASYWRSHNHRLSVHPATLCIDRDLAVALGGWSPLPTSEDTDLLLSANVVADGYFISDVGLYYRKWSEQITQSELHHDAANEQMRITAIEARLQALGKMSVPGLLGTTDEPH